MNEFTVWDVISSLAGVAGVVIGLFSIRKSKITEKRVNKYLSNNQVTQNAGRDAHLAGRDMDIKK